MRGLCRKFKSPTIENGFGFPTDTRTKKSLQKGQFELRCSQSCLYVATLKVQIIPHAFQ